MQLVICLTKEKIKEKSMPYYVRTNSEFFWSSWYWKIEIKIYLN